MTHHDNVMIKAKSSSFYLTADYSSSTNTGKTYTIPNLLSMSDMTLCYQPKYLLFDRQLIITLTLPLNLLEVASHLEIMKNIAIYVCSGGMFSAVKK